MYRVLASTKRRPMVSLLCAAVDDVFDTAFEDEPPAPLVCSASVDRISRTALSITLSYSTGTAEWMAAIASSPDDRALVRERLLATLTDRTTPLGSVAASFAARIAAHAPHGQVEDALAAMSHGSSRLQALVGEVLPVLNDGTAGAEAAEVCCDALFGLCAGTLQPLLHAAHANEDAAVAARLDELRGLLPRHLGIDARFWLDTYEAACGRYDDEALPYAPSIALARRLSGCASPVAALRTFVEACAAAARCTEGGIGGEPNDLEAPTGSGRGVAVGADELIPLMAYVLVRARPERLASLLALVEGYLMSSHSQPGLLLGVLGFGLATLEAAVRLVASLRWASTVEVGAEAEKEEDAHAHVHATCAEGGAPNQTVPPIRQTIRQLDPNQTVPASVAGRLHGPHARVELTQCCLPSSHARSRSREPPVLAAVSPSKALSSSSARGLLSPMRTVSAPAELPPSPLHRAAREGAAWLEDVRVRHLAHLSFDPSLDLSLRRALEWTIALVPPQSTPSQPTSLQPSALAAESASSITSMRFVSPFTQAARAHLSARANGANGQAASPARAADAPPPACRVAMTQSPSSTLLSPEPPAATASARDSARIVIAAAASPEVSTEVSQQTPRPLAPPPPPLLVDTSPVPVPSPADAAAGLVVDADRDDEPDFEADREDDDEPTRLTSAATPPHLPAGSPSRRPPASAGAGGSAGADSPTRALQRRRRRQRSSPSSPAVAATARLPSEELVSPPRRAGTARASLGSRWCDAVAVRGEDTENEEQRRTLADDGAGGAPEKVAMKVDALSRAAHIACGSPPRDSTPTRLPRTHRRRQRCLSSAGASPTTVPRSAEHGNEQDQELDA